MRPIKTKLFDLPNPNDTSSIDSWLEENPGITWRGSQSPWPGTILIFYQDPEETP